MQHNMSSELNTVNIQFLLFHLTNSLVKTMESKDSWRTRKNLFTLSNQKFMYETHHNYLKY